VHKRGGEGGSFHALRSCLPLPLGRYYATAGAKIVPAAAEVLAADVVLKVRPPATAEVSHLTPGSALLSFIYPAQNAALLQSLAAQRTTTLAMDQVPRISRAQVFDALSSMSNIAGYRAVVEACNVYGRFLMGQVTAAGMRRVAGKGSMYEFVH